jgi:uncharacterized protein YdhG (YjbR/CyaY superfamily)
MTAAEIDEYLSTVPEPKRATLEALRRSILAVIPELDGFEKTTGSLHFAIDTPLPDEIVAKLIAVRRAQALGD